MRTHLLQSGVWQKYEELEGKKAYRLEGEGYEALATLEQTPVGNYLLVKYGPAAEDKRALKKALKALQELAERKKVMFVRIEPTLGLKPQEAAKMGLKKTKNLDPEHTWVLDLAVSEEDLLGGMESRKVRYWRNYAKKGMKIRQTRDPEEIGILTRMLAGLGERDHFTPQNEQHLKNQLRAGFATLYIVELSEFSSPQEARPASPPSRVSGARPRRSSGSSCGNENSLTATIPIAAALVYDFEGVRYYAHAATDEEHRKLMAGTILLIQMILDAKEQGCEVYDFWGMTPSEDKNHPWYGFTQYKKSFGGRQVDYAGTYDLIVDPWKYRCYNLLRKANLALRKLRK